MPRCVLVKKRSADREPTTHVRTRRTTKRPKRNKFLVDEEVGDFIVVDTGTVGDTGTIGGTRNKFLVDEEVGDFIVVDTGTIGDTGTVEDIGRVGDTETVEDTGTVEDENPKPTSAFVCCDATGATLQGDGTVIQNKHRKSDIDPDAIQKARDALFVLESIPDLVEKERNRPPNSISLYCPSPDRESQQSRITRPSINARQSAPATERSSDLGPFRSHTQDSDMSDVPQAFLQSPCQTSRQNIVAGEPWTDSLTSHHDQPAQQLSKLRSDDASKASQSQGIAPLDPNKPRQSSIGITSTNNSIGQATGLMRRPLPEQNPHTSLPVSNFPTLSSTPSNFAGTRASHARRLHALPLQSSITPLPEPSLPSPSTSPQRRILTIDNGTNSTLSSADAQLIHTFTMHAIVLLRLDNTSTRDYPASVIIWRTLQNFYQWYITETRSAEISVLRFKLLDDPSKLEREFILSKGDLQRFQTLKQYIWNCFWVVLNMNGGAARFRILITPLRLGDELASHSSQAPRWSSVNATASGLLASPLPASNLENIRVAADHQLPATAVTRRHYEPPSPYPPPFRSDNDDITTPQTRSIPAQINRVSHQPLESIKDPSPSHHNSMWMDVITGVFETSRTANDKKRLRDRATELIAGREDVELEEDETTGGRKRVYPDVCGAVVDKYSAKGIVAITVHGFPVQQVDTGQGLIGEPYAELAIGVGQTCLIHGSSTVLYYKPRKASVSDQAPRPSQPRVATQPRESSIHEVVKLPSSPPEITIRLQMDEVGNFSAPYEFSVWRRKIKTTEFFAWFGSQTGRGGVKGPPLLTFTLKDAMPHRKSRDIAILGEDDFRWMRKHIIIQFDKAKLFMPGLKDFAVLVTDPGWFSRRR